MKVSCNDVTAFDRPRLTSRLLSGITFDSRVGKDRVRMMDHRILISPARFLTTCFHAGGLNGENVFAGAADVY